MQQFLEAGGYPAIFLLSLVSSMGLPVGAEIALIFGGVLASGQVAGDHHPLHVVPVILVALVAEVAGSLAGYAIGRFGGRPLVDRVGRYLLLTHRDLDRADAWFARRGEPAVFLGRLVPLLRSFVSLAAGLGEMALPRFAAFTVAGSAAWCTAQVLVGYSVGDGYEHAVRAFSAAGAVAAVLTVVGVGLAVAHRVRVVRAEGRAALEE